MRKFLKIALLVFGALLGLLVLSAFILFLGLPSPAEIGGYFSKELKSTQALQPTAAERTAETGTNVLPSNESGANPSEPVRESDESGNLNIKDVQDQQALQNLMDSQQSKSQVCENLIHHELIPDDFGYNRKSFGEKVKDALDDRQASKDPVILGILAPVRHFLQQPKMQDLIKMAEEAVRNGQESSLTEKAEFYGKVLGVYQEMTEQKQATEELLDRGYHLMMLARAVKKNPSLISDRQMQDFCTQVEHDLNVAAPMDWNAEKSRFQNLIEAMNVKPQDIGYDPNYKTTLKVERSSKGLQFHGGWIDELIPH